MKSRSTRPQLIQIISSDELSRSENGDSIAFIIQLVLFESEEESERKTFLHS